MATESTPLISQPDLHASAPRPAQKRTVTFNPQTSVSSASGTSTSSALRTSTQPSSPSQQHGDTTPPMLAALNNKLRRRNSHGSPQTPATLNPGPKLGPQRTTKVSQKLKILPNPDPGEDGPDEESGRDVYSQFTRIKDPTARRDAARLGKADRERLPRVTAYCTSSAYKLDAMMRYLKGRIRTRGANPKRFDECIYSPYRYGASALENSHQEEQNHISTPRRDVSIAEQTESSVEQKGEEPFNVSDQNSRRDSSDDIGPQQEHQNSPDFDTEVHTPEIFVFGYGTVVLWGLSIKEELRFLKELSKFETEKLAEEDVQTEEFNFYYTKDYQARIYNDFISLREKRNYMTKLAISHALAQSVKTSLYEDLVDNTIEATKDIPEQMAIKGRANLTLHQTNVKIGELFILRSTVHLQGTVLDTPQLLWTEPQLEPVYAAMRGYLEIEPRATVLKERLAVIAELLNLLRDLNTHANDEYLEWIVIVLIAIEIFIAAVNIGVDLWAGVD
ncbi:MAG: hypothetical protein M1814_005866 [Vezdaea aestivalis]|nr:MAG: hypothetical protein M1814_005866 [Vezdaea aestivalis]